MKILIAALFLSALAVGEVSDKHKLTPARADLVSDLTSVTPGEIFDVAYRFTIDPEWHVYWKNAGDSGTSPALTWKNPPGVMVEEIRWPYPERLEIPPFVNYGYTNEVFLPVRVHIPQDAKPGTVLKLAARADWLVCKESCLPGRKELTLDLPITTVKGSKTQWATAMDHARAQIPKANADWKVSAKSLNREVILSVEGKEGVPFDLLFFPWNAGDIENASLQKVESNAKGTTVTIAWDAQRQTSPLRMQGALVSSKGWDASRLKAIWIDVPVETQTSSTLNTMETTSIFQMFVFAFLGGLILNLMPCVFPVLSIKILNFVEQAGRAKNKIRTHGWIFAVGVMVSFWTLSGVLIALRASGMKLGWGFQLQSPIFILALAVLMFLMSLNLLGLFEIGTRMMGAGSSLSSQEGYRGSFFTGVLATIVATPCTAPFMGSAIGYALTQPPFASLFVFTGVGLGMALPYLLLSYFPGLLKFLPKPGRWMESLKQFMAFPLFATVVWLVWVFGLQTGMDGVLRLLAALLSISVGAWMHHRFASSKAVILRGIGVSAFMLIAVYAGISGARLKAAGAKDVAHVGVDGVKWEAFSPARVTELSAQGKPIFVDFTAAWCVSCQVNEKLIFSSQEVLDTFKKLDVVMMKADWTDGDQVITDALAKFNRSGVPFYLLYGKTPNAAPQQLPEVLTPDIVLKALANL